MATYRFSAAERWAVFTVHKSHCYLCKKPIDFSTMHVDHIIPESLSEEPEKLAEVLSEFGLPGDFNLNSFENWLPACMGCNLQKNAKVFEPAPIMLDQLKTARSKAGDVAKFQKRFLSRQQYTKALGLLEVGIETNQIDVNDLLPLIGIFVSAHPKAVASMPSQQREDDDYLGFLTTDDLAQPVIELRLTPTYRVLARSNRTITVETQYGVGYVPDQPNPDRSFYCGSCGSLGPWSGARCLTCGFLDDGD